MRTARGRGRGWVGLSLGAPKAVSHGLRDLTLSVQWVPTSGCLVSQPPKLLTTPEPHHGAGVRYHRPACVCSRCASIAGTCLRGGEGGS